MKYNVSDNFGPITPTSADDQAIVRGLIAGQPDESLLLEILGAGEWA